MEQHVEELVMVDYRHHVCLYGFDETLDEVLPPIHYSSDYLKTKAKQVHEIKMRLHISLSGALSLCGVTPDEWEQMKGFFEDVY